METTLQYQDRLQFAEVYISDMSELKTIFLQKFNISKVNENFGIPFLLVKKNHKTVAFASLVINQDDEIDFEIYETERCTKEEKDKLTDQAKTYFERNDSENFTNREQLISSIARMIHWLNS